MKTESADVNPPPETPGPTSAERAQTASAETEPKPKPKKPPPTRLLFVDLETSTLSPSTGEILEIGAILTSLDGQTVLEEFSAKIKPQKPVSPKAAAVNGYSPELWAYGFNTLQAPLRALSDLSADAVFVAHNVPFDWGWLEVNLEREQITWPGSHRRVCTQTLAWPLVAFGLVESAGLDALGKFLGLPDRTAHVALDDARRCRTLYLALMERFTPGLVELTAGRVKHLERELDAAHSMLRQVRAAWAVLLTSRCLPEPDQRTLDGFYAEFAKSDALQLSVEGLEIKLAAATMEAILGGGL